MHLHEIGDEMFDREIPECPIVAVLLRFEP